MATGKDSNQRTRIESDTTPQQLDGIGIAYHQSTDIAADARTTIRNLSRELTAAYGKGFTKTNLYQFTQFYRFSPKIFHTVCGQSLPVLSWSHYRELLRVTEADARTRYAREAAKQAWSVRTLKRNIEHMPTRRSSFFEIVNAASTQSRLTPS